VPPRIGSVLCEAPCPVGAVSRYFFGFHFLIFAEVS
jgi:hypothetical protein